MSVHITFAARACESLFALEAGRVYQGDAHALRASSGGQRRSCRERRVDFAVKPRTQPLLQQGQEKPTAGVRLTRCQRHVHPLCIGVSSWQVQLPAGQRRGQPRRSHTQHAGARAKGSRPSLRVPARPWRFIAIDDGKRVVGGTTGPDARQMDHGRHKPLNVADSSFGKADGSQRTQPSAPSTAAVLAVLDVVFIPCARLQTVWKLQLLPRARRGRTEHETRQIKRHATCKRGSVERKMLHARSEQVATRLLQNQSDVAASNWSCSSDEALRVRADSAFALSALAICAMVHTAFPAIICAPTLPEAHSVHQRLEGGAAGEKERLEPCWEGGG